MQGIHCMEWYAMNKIHGRGDNALNAMHGMQCMNGLQCLESNGIDGM